MDQPLPLGGFTIPRLIVSREIGIRSSRLMSCTSLFSIDSLYRLEWTCDRVDRMASYFAFFANFALWPFCAFTYIISQWTFYCWVWVIEDEPGRGLQSPSRVQKLQPNTRSRPSRVVRRCLETHAFQNHYFNCGPKQLAASPREHHYRVKDSSYGRPQLRPCLSILSSSTARNYL